MVYRGPSRGCGRCRLRHIRCDQNSPICNKCKEKGYSCPGYGDVFARAHRDETMKVVKRNSQTLKVASRNKPSFPRLCAFQFGSGNESSHFTSEIPAALSPNVETLALGFFFLWYGHSYGVETTCGYFDILPAIFSRSSQASLLTTATTSLALLVTALHARLPQGHDTFTLACKTYQDALEKTRVAVACRSRSKSDELLLAVLVLETYDTLMSVFRTGRQYSGPRAHILGAVAILEHRGSINYRDELSWRLVAATQSRLIRKAGDAVLDSSILETFLAVCHSDSQRRMDNPELESDSLALELAWLRSNFRNLQMDQHRNSVHGELKTAPNQAATINYNTQIDSLISHAAAVTRKCAQWYLNLSPVWKPVSVAVDATSSPILDTLIYDQASPTVYYNLFICNLYNRHRVTEIGLLLFIRFCFTARFANTGEYEELPHSLVSRLQSLLDDVCASILFMTGDLLSEFTYDMEFPWKSALSTSGAEGSRWNFPASKTEHCRQITSSGLFMTYNVLKELVKLLPHHHDTTLGAPMVREGQVDWIQKQLTRIKSMLGFDLR